MLLIRVDGSVQIGTGHVMRCLSLAAAWSAAGGQIHFVLAECTPALHARLDEFGAATTMLKVAPGSTADAVATIALADKLTPSWIVADGYSFGTEWQKQVHTAGYELLVFDDYGHAAHYYADVILNQNLDALAELYASRESYTQLLLGTSYAVLRPEFNKWREWRRQIRETAQAVLITLGGADPNNVTSTIMDALSPLTNLTIVLAIGGTNPHRSVVERIISGMASPVQLMIDATTMGELMAEADVAIAAGGTTSWELAFMGLPSIVVTLADNQRRIVAALTRSGISVDAGAIESLDFAERLRSSLTRLAGSPVTRKRMSELGRKQVDGFGAKRVVGLMLTSGSSEQCLARAAQ
jgi:UDP-2,4-diacetamido-2,4,6-trideoxy-beta-L-altropyranose hydrolase